MNVFDRIRRRTSHCAVQMTAHYSVYPRRWNIEYKKGRRFGYWWRIEEVGGNDGMPLESNYWSPTKKNMLNAAKRKIAKKEHHREEGTISL